MTKTSSEVLNAVISLEVSKGHLKWKVTELARKSGIGRELIYYHFGKTKKDILERCFDLITSEFYGMSDDRTALVKSGNLLESLRQTHRMFLDNPSFGIFYIKWRTSPSPLQTKYLEIEAKYQQRLKQLFPHLSSPEILALHALLHGLVTSPFLTDKALESAASWLKKILEKQH